MSKSNNTAKAARVSKPKMAKARKLVETPAEFTNEQAKVAKLRKARTTKAASDTIIVSKSLATGNGTYVEAANGKSVIVAPWQDKGATRKLAVVGASLAALQAHIATLTKPTAKLANGVDARTAPQSAKAVADQAKGKAPTENKGKARTAKAAKAKAPAKGSNRTYKLGSRKDESKPDTFRRYMLSTIMAHKDTDSAKAAHAKSRKYPTHKLDFNWAAQQGYIVING